MPQKHILSAEVSKDIFDKIGLSDPFLWLTEATLCTRLAGAK